MEIKIGVEIGTGMIFVPGQTFVFGSIAFLADSAGHLGQLETSVQRQAIRLGDLEHTVGSHREKGLAGWVSDQTKGLYETRAQTPISCLAHGDRENSSSDLPSGQDPTTPLETETASQVDNKGPRSMLDQILERLPLVAMSDRVRGECKRNLPCAMLNLAKESAIFGIQICAHDRICESPVEVRFSFPSTTHLVATI